MYRSELDKTSELDSSTLYPVSSEVDSSTLHRYLKAKYNSMSGTDYLLAGYTIIQNGVLKYWGTPLHLGTVAVRALAPPNRPLPRMSCPLLVTGPVRIGT